jgi:hypothetical protein
MTRRNFLTSLLSLFVGILGLTFLSRPKQWVYNFAILFRPRLDPLSPTGALSDAGMETVVAFGEALVGERPFSETEKGYLSRHIDHQTKTAPGYFSVYRATAKLLQRLSPSGEFSKLSLGDRLKLVTRHGLLSYDVQAREYLLPFHREELIARTLAVPDLIGGYYASPAGWAVVHYETFPGRCGDLSRYTREDVRIF